MQQPATKTTARAGHRVVVDNGDGRGAAVGVLETEPAAAAEAAEVAEAAAVATARADNNQQRAAKLQRRR